MSQPVSAPPVAPAEPAKPWWRSKTIWFNALVILASLGSIPLTGAVGPAVGAKILAASAAANIALRVITTQPLEASTKGGQQP